MVWSFFFATKFYNQSWDSYKSLKIQLFCFLEIHLIKKRIPTKIWIIKKSFGTKKKQHMLKIFFFIFLTNTAKNTQKAFCIYFNYFGNIRKFFEKLQIIYSIKACKITENYSWNKRDLTWRDVTVIVTCLKLDQHINGHIPILFPICHDHATSRQITFVSHKRYYYCTVYFKKTVKFM